MSRFDFPPSIRSRPIWGTLSPKSGDTHLMIADAEGAGALVDLAKVMPEIMARAHVIYIPKGTGQRFVDVLTGLGPRILHVSPTWETCLPRLRRVLSDAHVGMQICLAGTEGLMGQAMREATDAGIPHTAIQTEHRGSVARRIQCVHCKGITEDVTASPFVCAHCGLNLFVRDHYSRRIAAYQGVCVDAEDPGLVPPRKDIYA